MTFTITRYLFISAMLFIMNTAVAQSPKGSREIQKDYDVSPTGRLVVKTNGQYLELKTWNQPKIRMVLIISDTTSEKISVDEMLAKKRIRVTEFTSLLEIDAQYGGIINQASYQNPSNISSNIAGGTGDVLAGTGRPITAASSFYKSSLQKMIIYYPENVSLKINCKYSDVRFPGNIQNAEIDLYTCQMEAADFKNIRINANSSFVIIGNIEKGTIDFKIGNLRVETIADAEMTTYASTVEIRKVKKLNIRSSNDEYLIDEAEQIQGRKTYNVMRIDKITGLIDLVGNNFDLKLRTIDAKTELVRVINQYGNLRLPVRGLNNYQVDFRGKYSKAYTVFDINFQKGDKKPTTLTERQQSEAGYPNNANYQNHVYYSEGVFQPGGSPDNFTATVGDTKAKHTRFDLSCNSCTVDFK